MTGREDDNLIELILEEDFEDAGLPIPDSLSGMPLPGNKEVSKIPPRMNISTSSNSDGDSTNNVKSFPGGFEYHAGFGKSFAHEAEILVNFTVQEAEFVPFMSYWPTYRSMTPDQRNWYFWWRNEVRKGFYPDTDLSYIFILIYELINNVGVKDGVDGCNKLCEIWTYYRDRHPKLDKYLSEWLIDYITINNCPVNPVNIINEITGGHLQHCSIDMVLSYYINGGLDKLPLELIEQLTYYKVTKSKFYKNSGKSLLADYVPRVIHTLNQALLKGTGIGIFDKFKPLKVETKTRVPFQSALYGEGNVEPISYTILSYTEHYPLKHFLTGVVKAAENKLRELEGFSGRLKSFSIDKQAAAIIDKYLESEFKLKKAELNRIKVNIDVSKVIQLTEDSDAVRDKLLTGFDSEDVDCSVSDGAVADSSYTGYGNFSLSFPDNSGSSVNTDNSPDISYPAGMPKELPDVPAGVPEEWLEFRNTLPQHLLKTLKAILYSEDIDTELMKICEENLAMPEVLIDSINEYAMEVLRDIIVVPGSSPPCIEEEYKEVIKKVIQRGEGIE